MMSGAWRFVNVTSTQKAKVGGCRVPGKHGLYNKMLSHKNKGWECSSVIEYLPQMYKALDLILSIRKR
jgi:hypothetical protein